MPSVCDSVAKTVIRGGDDGMELIVNSTTGELKLLTV